LSGLSAIKTAQADKGASAENGLEFELTRAARIYIAYDAEAKEIPRWLRAFAPQKMAFIVNQWGTERWMNVYSKDFDAGRVVLGGNLAEGARGNVFLNYAVVVRAKT
jgi:hypothetical protein